MNRTDTTPLWVDPPADGGPLFPQFRFDPGAPLHAGPPGATLRDLFAAAALAGMLAHREYDPNLVWKIADQVLKARAWQPTPPAPPAEGGAP